MIIKQLHVDLWQKILQPITVVQHEAEGRRLAITLTGGGLPVNLTGCDVVFYAQKPDENILFNNCVIVDEAAGQVEYTITEQTVVLAGTLKCWIVVIKDGKTIRSQEFHITVQESPDFTGAVESTSEFTDLEVALATIAGFDARLTAAEGRLGIAEEEIITGWIPVTAQCLYISPTTLSIEGDVTSIIRRGYKLRWKQGAAYKYNYVLSASYNDGVTTITITPWHITTAGDSSFASSPDITDVAYSHIENPAGFPGWHQYTPTFSASGSMTFTSVTVDAATAKMVGDEVRFRLSASGTTGGSASNSIVTSLPVPTANTYHVFNASMNSGSAGAMLASIATNLTSSTDITVRSFDASSITLKTGMRVAVNGFYS